MPRRVGWGVLIEAENGARLWQPVDSQAQALTAIERLAPIVPLTSCWSMGWRDG